MGEGFYLCAGKRKTREWKTYTVGEDTGKGGGNAANDVEDGVSLSDLICIQTGLETPRPKKRFWGEKKNIHRVYQVLRR